MTQKERILIVDDDPAMLYSVGRILAPRYAVESVGTATKAPEAARAFAPDLAILDIRMPEMDGFELMAALRDVRPNVDVIFMTGVVHEVDEKLVRAIRERAFYFIQKPFDREVLLTIVERCLELRRLESENRKHVEELEQELEEARVFQRSLLPPETARFPGVSIAARCIPSTELGGDLYDYLRTDAGDVTVMISDVSGHGARAAMLTAVVKSSFRESQEAGIEPLSAVRRVARAIEPFGESQFVTMLCVRLRLADRVLEMASAGHFDGLLWGAQRSEPVFLRSNGPLLYPRVYNESNSTQDQVELLPSDRLLLYTDGLTEVRGEAGEYGQQRLFDSAMRSELRGLALVERIVSDVRVFTGERTAPDDQTLLTVELDPPR